MKLVFLYSCRIIIIIFILYIYICIWQSLISGLWWLWMWCISFFSLLLPQPEWWRTCKIKLELGTCRIFLFLGVLGVGKKINCYFFVWKWFVNDNVERPPNSFFYICFLSHKKMSVCSLDSFCPSIWLDSLESIVLCCKKIWLNVWPPVADMWTMTMAEMDKLQDKAM